MQRILVPLDGSPLAERALPYAETLARRTGARLVLLRTVEAHALTVRGRSEARGALMIEAETYLDGVAARLRERGFSVDLVLSDGNAAEEIEEEIVLRAIDLVVMATHGRSGLGRWVYGSVAECVLHLAEVPVLLVRAWQSEPSGDFAAAPRIVVPLDGSHFAEAALPVARDLAKTLGGELLLVRAVAPPDIALVSAMTYITFDTDEELATATTYLNTIAAANPDIPTKILAYPGPSVPVIAAAARENDAALIVMATHDRSGFGRFLLGSVADMTLREGSVPLLLVRPRGADASEAAAAITSATER